MMSSGKLFHTDTIRGQKEYFLLLYLHLSVLNLIEFPRVLMLLDCTRKGTVSWSTLFVNILCIFHISLISSINQSWNHHKALNIALWRWYCSARRQRFTCFFPLQTLLLRVSNVNKPDTPTCSKSHEARLSVHSTVTITHLSKLYNPD